MAAIPAVKNLPPAIRDAMLQRIEAELRARNAPVPTPTKQKVMPSFHDWLCEVTPSFNWNYPHMLFLQQLFEDWIAHKFRHVMLSMPPQHGKLLADSTYVPTPLGWRSHKDLQVGDYVFHPSGRPIRVVGISEPGEADVEVEFTNGEVVICHEKHEWTLYDRSKPGWYICEAGYLLDQDVWSGERARFQLPEIGAIELPEATLPMPPYVLGAWLGDGSSNKPAITHAPQDVAVAEAVEELGYQVSARCVHPETGCVTVYFAGDARSRCASAFTRALRELNVINNKHIPEVYKWSSIQQRLELLAGLVDTDGHVQEKTGRVRIITCSLGLALDIREVAEGLGWHPGISEQVPLRVPNLRGIVGRQTVYSVAFQPTLPLPTKLERKQVVRFAPRRKVGVRRVARRESAIPGKCIQVDSLDGLYLVGRRLTPTHNSSAITVRGPAYLIERDPTIRIMVAAYDDTLARMFSRQTRSILQGRVALSKEKQAQDEWETTAGGGLLAGGLRSGFSGRPSHVTFIDDPVKNRREAESKAFREATVAGYRDDLRTRLNLYKGMPGKIWLTMTRWHFEDLAGQIQRSQEAEDWHVVVLPALAEENDPLGRQVGEALCPELHPLSELIKLQKALPRTFISLYQGRPAPAEGSVLQLSWFKRYKTPPARYKRVVQSWDSSMKGSQINDPWACITIGEAVEGGFYILEVYCQHLNYPEGKRQVLSQYRKWRPDIILIEDKSSGEALIQEYKQEQVEDAPGQRLPIKGVQPEGDKVARASEESDTIEAGLVWLPEWADWLPEFESEIVEFPLSSNDDQVDALSQCLHYLVNKKARMKMGTFKVGTAKQSPPKDGYEPIEVPPLPTREEMERLQTNWTWKDIQKYRR